MRDRTVGVSPRPSARILGRRDVAGARCSFVMSERGPRDPREDKIVSYQRDRRNSYGHSPHGSTGHDIDQGPCWISVVRFNRSWKTAYWHGKTLRPMAPGCSTQTSSAPTPMRSTGCPAHTVIELRHQVQQRHAHDRRRLSVGLRRVPGRSAASGTGARLGGPLNRSLAASLGRG